MPDMKLLYPLWLLALAAIPLAWLLERNSFSALGLLQRRFATVIRTILFLLLVLALCGFQTRDPNRTMQVIYVLDASRSIPTAEVDRALAWIDAASSTLTEQQRERTESALMVFGRNASFEQGFSRKLEVGTLQSVIDDGNTDLSRALDLASAVFEPGADKRVVLFSDGRETLGNAEEFARRLRQRGVAVDTVPIGAEVADDVLARKVIVPQAADRKETFAVKCVVDSSSEKEATLKLFRNNVFISQHPVSLKPGRNVFSFNQTEPAKGFYTYSFEIDAPGDSVGANNRARSFTFVEGEPRLLYLTGDPNEQPDLAAMLAPKEINIEFRQTGFMPHDLADLMVYDALFFSDVSAETLTPEQQTLIQGYVKALGKGFVMLGGPQSFGVGGWYRTPVEEVLPVTMDFKRQQHFPSTGLCIVIDRSGSMSAMAGSYTKLDLAKKAAVESGSVLTNRDYIGVIQFDDAGYWVTDKMQQLTSKTRFRAQVGSISIGGGTNIYAGLRPAVDELTKLPAQVKHIILLTDGMSAPGDYDRIIRDCKAAGITLTTVATGPDSDERFLKNLATRGGGRYYPLPDARNLPRIFTKETFLAATKSVIEEPFTPNPGEVHPITDGFPFVGSQPLLGYNATTKKDLASVTMFTPQGDPLFAHWNYGLGKSMAFTSDARRRWGAAWMGWSPAQALWTQSVRWLTGEQESKELVAQVSRDGARTTITVDSFTSRGDLDAEGKVTAHVVTPSLETLELPMRQVAPGRFELQELFADDGNYIVNVVKEQGDQVTGVLHTGFAVSYSPEYDAGPPNTFLLTRIAELTQGTMNPEPPMAYRPVEFTGELGSWKDWSFPLLMACILLFPLDIAVRRIMLPEEGLRTWSEAAIAGLLGLFRPVEAAARRVSRPATVAPAWRREAETSARRAEQKAPPSPEVPPSGPVRISKQQSGDPEALQRRVGSILAGSGKGNAPGEAEAAGDDTYARLLEAKRRAREKADGSEPRT